MSHSAILPTQTTDDVKSARNNRLAIFLVLFVVGMVGASFAAVPLYKIFCSVTGYGGTTQIAQEESAVILDRKMSVRFDSNIDRNLAWEVKPAKTVKFKIGQTQIINYVATNLGSQTTTATASFNVAPAIAGYYFNKIECFCFTEQTLAPGQTIEMPVVFFIDPELVDDSDLDTLGEITLSYTFHATENPESTVALQTSSNNDSGDKQNGGS